MNDIIRSRQTLQYLTLHSIRSWLFLLTSTPLTMLNNAHWCHDVSFCPPRIVAHVIFSILMFLSRKLFEAYTFPLSTMASNVKIDQIVHLWIDLLFVTGKGRTGGPQKYFQFYGFWKIFLKSWKFIFTLLWLHCVSFCIIHSTVMECQLYAKYCVKLQDRKMNKTSFPQEFII